MPHPNSLEGSTRLALHGNQKRNQCPIIVALDARLTLSMSWCRGAAKNWCFRCRRACTTQPSATDAPGKSEKPTEACDRARLAVGGTFGRTDSFKHRPPAQPSGNCLSVTQRGHRAGCQRLRQKRLANAPGSHACTPLGKHETCSHEPFSKYRHMVSSHCFTLSSAR